MRTYIIRIVQHLLVRKWCFQTKHDNIFHIYKDLQKKFTYIKLTCIFYTSKPHFLPSACLQLPWASNSDGLGRWSDTNNINAPNFTLIDRNDHETEHAEWPVGLNCSGYLLWRPLKIVNEKHFFPKWGKIFSSSFSAKFFVRAINFGFLLL